MKFNENLLFGIYEISKLESFKGGKQTTEKAKSGMFVFTRNHKLSVVSGSNEWVMAYTGNFEVKEDILHIHVNSCVVREMEGTTITRKIMVMDGQKLVLDASGSDKEKHTQISWRKLQDL